MPSASPSRAEQILQQSRQQRQQALQHFRDHAGALQESDRSCSLKVRIFYHNIKELKRVDTADLLQCSWAAGTAISLVVSVLISSLMLCIIRLLMQLASVIESIA